MTATVSQPMIDRANDRLIQRAPLLANDFARRRADAEGTLCAIDQEAAQVAERVAVCESNLGDLVKLQTVVLALEHELAAAREVSFESLRLDDMLSDNLDPLVALKINAAFAELQRAELTVRHVPALLNKRRNQLGQGIASMRAELEALQLSAGPMLGILRRVRQDLAGAVDLLAAELSPQTHN